MIHPDLHHETRVGFPKYIVVGADEVGRGCLAGPVVAGAVALPSLIDFDADPWLREVGDSKLVRQSVREKLAPLIAGWALASAIGVASVEEIDRYNIFHASHLAIVRAVKALSVGSKKISIHHVLIDGKFIPKDLPASSTAVVKGDQKCLSIAAASIIAKVWRDNHMVELDKKFPGYGFSRHKGYPTVVHSTALKKQGVCEVHRRSFAQVAALV